MKVTRRTFVASSLALAACAMARPMPNGKTRGAPGPVVIVPGTGAGPWAYAKLAKALVARGRDCVPLALPGMSERYSEIKPEIDVNVHAQDVAHQLSTLNLRDVTLVGHSYGGMVITGAIGRAPDRIRSLVYYDAYVPANGESLVDQDRGFGEFIQERVNKDGEGWKIPAFPADQFLTSIEDKAEWAEKVTACPYALFTAKLKVDEAAFASVHKGYVSCNQFQYFIRLGDDLHARSGWPLSHLPFGHLSCITNPDETADAILAVESA